MVSAKIVAGPEMLQLAADPVRLRQLLSQDGPDVQIEMDESLQLSIVPLQNNVYVVELRQANHERALQLLNAILQRLVKESVELEMARQKEVVPAITTARKAQLEKLENALKTIRVDSTQNILPIEVVVDALIEARSY